MTENTEATIYPVDFEGISSPQGNMLTVIKAADLSTFAEAGQKILGKLREGGLEETAGVFEEILKIRVRMANQIVLLYDNTPEDLQAKHRAVRENPKHGKTSRQFNIFSVNPSNSAAVLNSVATYPNLDLEKRTRIEINRNGFNITKAAQAQNSSCGAVIRNPTLDSKTQRSPTQVWAKSIVRAYLDFDEQPYSSYQPVILTTANGKFLQPSTTDFRTLTNTPLYYSSTYKPPEPYVEIPRSMDSDTVLAAELTKFLEGYRASTTPKVIQIAVKGRLKYYIYKTLFRA